nr:hypothetical protein [uncultured Prevotella sp.]
MKDKDDDKITEDQERDFLGDIGNIDLPDLDVNMVDFLPAEEMEETRYVLPKVVRYNSEEFVLYDNAVKLAKELKVGKGMRADAFIAGSFIFGDFIEAFLRVHNVRAKEMTISTLSLSQENVDSLAALMKHGYIGKLNLIISVYFWSHERSSLLPYIYKSLDKDDRFQLSVCGMHTKTCHFETEGGKKIVMHGSANLRSSGNIEQFTIEENPKLYDFYNEEFSKVIEKYATIRKPIRNSRAWDIFTKKYFKD